MTLRYLRRFISMLVLGLFTISLVGGTVACLDSSFLTFKADPIDDDDDGNDGADEPTEPGGGT